MSEGSLMGVHTCGSVSGMRVWVCGGWGGDAVGCARSCLGHGDNCHRQCTCVCGVVPIHACSLQLARWPAASAAPAPETPSPSQPKKKACMSAAGAPAATDAAAKTQLPEVELMVGGEEELPAARAAIQFAYTGRVEGGIRKALQVRRQAAYLQMEGCVEACMAAVREQLLRAAAGGGGAGAGAAAAAAAAAGFGGGAAAAEVPPPPTVLALYSCHDVWPDPTEDAAFAALLPEAKRRLVAHFGDAVAVLNSQRLFEQMRALPAEGMKVLLESNDFGTDNESSVVLMLAE